MALPRPGRVGGDALGDDLDAQGALAAALDGAVGRLEQHREVAGRAARARCRRRGPRPLKLAVDLLALVEEEGEVTARLGDLGGDAQHDADAALHVDRAAAPQLAVDAAGRQVGHRRSGGPCRCGRPGRPARRGRARCARRPCCRRGSTSRCASGRRAASMASARAASSWLTDSMSQTAAVSDVTSADRSRTAPRASRAAGAVVGSAAGLVDGIRGRLSGSGEARRTCGSRGGVRAAGRRFTRPHRSPISLRPCRSATHGVTD